MMAYKTAFSGLSVNSWAMMAPVNPGKVYVVYQPIQNVQDDSITCNGANVYMRVSIFDDNVITGKSSNVNIVADEIFQALNNTLSLSNYQNWNTDVSDDRLIENSIGQLVQVQRIITFKHGIYFN